MSGAEVAQIIASMAALVASIGSIVVGVRNSRKIEQVHTSTNGMKDELVREVRAASVAKGLKQGREETR